MKNGKLTQIFVVLSVLLLTGATFAGCIDLEEEEDEDHLIIAQMNEPAEINPITWTDLYGGYLMRTIYDPLIQNTPDGNPNTNDRAVATSVEESDDLLTYTFEIQEGIEFHHGEEMTAEDVIFSLDTIRGVEEEKYGVEPQASPRAAEFAVIESIEEVDDYTIEINLEEVDAEFLLKGGFEALMIMPKDYIVENGWDDYLDELYGTGPYEFVDYSPGDEFVVEAFDDYWGEVNIEKVTFDFYDDEAAAVTALRTGDVHFMPDIGTRNWHDLVEEDEDEVVTRSYPTIAHSRIAFNHDEGPFTDERVRKAFAYAADMDEMIEVVRTSELGDPGRSPYPPGNPARPDDLKQYERTEENLEKAEDLLADAGYEDGLETEIYVTEGDGEDELAVLKEQLADIGIELEIIALEWGGYIDAVETGEAKLSYSGWVGKASAEYTINYMMPYSAWNYYSGWYDNEEVGELVREALRTTGEERWELYHEAQRILFEEDMGVYVTWTRRRPHAYWHTLDMPEDSWNPFMGQGPIYRLNEWDFE